MQYEQTHVKLFEDFTMYVSCSLAAELRYRPKAIIEDQWLMTLIESMAWVGAFSLFLDPVLVDLLAIICRFMVLSVTRSFTTSQKAHNSSVNHAKIITICITMRITHHRTTRLCLHSIEFLWKFNTLLMASLIYKNT
jgi:hypothetical protein